MSSVSLAESLDPKVAEGEELHLSVNIFGPKLLILVHGNIKPRLHVSIEMDDCCIMDLFQIHTRIVPKPHYMPRLVQWCCCHVECHQSCG